MPPALETSPSLAPAPGLAKLFGAFAKISLISFGGGLSGLLYRDIVQTRRWVTEADFFAALALSQAMPGANVSNLAVWLGYKLRGRVGALMACLGTLVPPGILIIFLGAVIARFSGTSSGAIILAGVAASALGISLSMGVRITRRAVRDPLCGVVFAVALGSALMHGSVVLIIAVLAPVSVGLAYIGLRDE